MNQRVTFLLFLMWCTLTATSLLACTQNSPSPSSANPDRRAETVVYLVRHGEKAPSTGAMEDDPALSDAGQQRAKALQQQLAGVKVQALFATKYKRTQETVQPLAQETKLPVQIYEAHDFKGLTEKIKKNHAGQTVVVAGHSNTLLPLVEAMGGKKPFTEITDAQYDYLFKVTLRDGQETLVEVSKYGAPSK